MAAGRIVISEYAPARDRDDTLVAGAKLYVYNNETTTLATIYTSASLTTPLANPVVANSSGQFAQIWADNTLTYSVSITGPDGQSIGNPSVFDDYSPSTNFAVSEVLEYKAPVRVASTANITIASALINGSTIDGVVVATGDRVLLKDQSTGSQNGIYVVVASGAAMRSGDADTSAKVMSGMTMFVSEGSANGGAVFTLTTANPIVLGTTALTFSRYAGIGILPVANGGTGAATPSGARTNLGLVIGTDVQAYAANLTTWAGVTPGTGVATALAANIGSAGAPVLFNGAGGTPSSLALTNATNLPISTGVSGLGTGVATALAVNVGSAGAFLTSTALSGSGGSALVGFIQSGTGAVARTLQSKARDYVSIKDFGAACDGVTDDTAAIEAAMAAHDNILIPGYVKANITWPRAGVRIFGNSVGQFSQTTFDYTNGTLLEAFNSAEPVITINPDLAGENLRDITIERMTIAGLGKAADAISIEQTGSGTYGISDMTIRDVNTRSALWGLDVDCEVLWMNIDNLVHEFCFGGARVQTARFCNGWSWTNWTARRNQKFGFYFKKTDVSISGFQAWSGGLLSSDYNGDLASVGVQTGAVGIHIENIEGLTVEETVAEGNGFNQVSADGIGINITGTATRAIDLGGMAVESNPIPFRWSGSNPSGTIAGFYRISSPTAQPLAVISAGYSQGIDGTGGGRKIVLEPSAMGVVTTTFDGGTGGYPTYPSVDYIPIQGTTLNLTYRNAATINCGSSSATISTLQGLCIGNTYTLFNYAVATANTITLSAGLMWDGVASVVAANTAKQFFVLGFPYEGKLVAL